MSEYSLTYSVPVPRASALPPAERRGSIVAVALRLIAERGTMPTTREIADEAGIAEGTVFRAFETKERLVDAIVGQAFCPIDVAGRLSTVDADLPLRDRLVAQVTLMQNRFREIFGVMSALGLTAPPDNIEQHRGCSPATGHVAPEDQDPHQQNAWRPGRLIASIAPDADQLSCTPNELFKYLRLLTFSGSHPEISQDGVLAPETIVDVVLTGVLARRPGDCAHTQSVRKAD